MEFINPYAVIVAAFSTFLVGFIWYSPAVFGKIWMKETGMTHEKAQKSNMLKIFGLTFIFSILVAFMVSTMVIHQLGALALVGGPSKVTTALPSYLQFMNDYKNEFRTFHHGALHGFLVGIAFVFPITAINSLFEHKSWNYILITSGYWVISLMLMGAIICGWQ